MLPGGLLHHCDFRSARLNPYIPLQASPTPFFVLCKFVQRGDTSSLLDRLMSSHMHKSFVWE